MEILRLENSSYENGKISGEYFRNRVKINVKDIEAKLNNDVQVKNKVIKQFNKLKVDFPKYFDEVVGKADGLKIDRITYFSILCPEIMELNFEHCTTIICKKNNGNFIISHNEDDDYIEGNFCLSKVKIDEKNWFVTNDMYNMPFGNGISWNSYGIIKTINYCHDENINTEYLSRYFSQRHISEASSIEDLIKRCQEMKIASGYHINAIDINNNVAVSIEVYNEDIDIEYIDNYYIHSNHFIHGKYQLNQTVDSDSNSIFRLNMANELINKSDYDLDSIKKILNYRSKENEFSNSILQTREDPYETIFNFSFDTENKDAIFLNIYANNENYVLNYDKLNNYEEM